MVEVLCPIPSPLMDIDLGSIDTGSGKIPLRVIFFPSASLAKSPRFSF